MNKKVKGVFWGLVLVIIGVIITLNALEIDLGLEVFFKGWWTLFIIVPCAIEFFTEKNKFGSSIGILIGVGLLLAARDIITFGQFFKLILPVLLIILGLYVIFRTFVTKPCADSKENVVTENTSQDTKTTGNAGANYSAIFTGEDVKFDGQRFEGTALTALFGGVECDLRGAVIDHDVTITATAIFGGVDIMLPTDIRLHIDSSAAFLGGVSNQFRTTADASSPVITIRPTCVFGGIDIK